MTNPTEAKRKSAKRFEQLNRIVDEIAPSLKTPSHVAALLVCFRHAGPGGRFAVSNRRIAHACNLTPRQIIRIMDDLEAAGVISLEADHVGPIPKRYRITGKTAEA